MNHRGFTLIEGLVAIVLLAVGVAGVHLALGAVARNTARVEESGRMLRLGSRKLDELIASGEAATGNAAGDFSAEGLPSVTWNMITEPTGVANLNAIILTVQGPNDTEDNAKQIRTLLYTPPVLEQ
jgi:prepilin-type N-terminal cleavage/methylation domain-containing protein